MTDRELLEAAAKAAGYTHRWLDDIDSLVILGATGVWQAWNPIDDDADAFRLMVDCNVDTVQSRHEVFATAYNWDIMERGSPYTELFSDHNNDKHAATRRAIVRAAAGE